MASECRSAEDRSIQARLSDRSCGVGGCTDLSMGAPQATRADDAQTDAAAQRDRGMGDDDQNGMGPVQTSCAVVQHQMLFFKFLVM